MGTAILRSHDCLQRRFLPNDALSIPSSHHLRSRRNSNANPNSNQNRRRKRSPVANVHVNQHDRKQSVDRSHTPAKSTAASNLVMGQVKILKRGEKLSPEIPISQGGIAVPVVNHKVRVTNEGDLDLILGTTDRFGPDPVTMQKQIRVSESKNGIYAGTAFASSPPPSSVPVPFFLGKNGSATSDLIRLLRLNLDD